MDNTDSAYEILKDCSTKTKAAVLCYRKNKDVKSLSIIVIGIIEKHLEDEYKLVLKSGGDDLLITEDLGIDSIIMMEVVMNIEEVLNLSVPNEELTDLRSVGDLKFYLEKKSQGLPIPSREQLDLDNIGANLPYKKSFTFVQQAEIYGNSCTGFYRINGDELFLNKNGSSVPTSIVLESLSQLAALMLLNSKGLIPNDKLIDYSKVLFIGCDGLRCFKLCSTNDILNLKVSLESIKYPVAFFKGVVFTNKSKVVTVKNISLTFDYIK
jgi:3-hydroxyacyl-[acyl-carrier-protein] dehydratase